MDIPEDFTHIFMNPVTSTWIQTAIYFFTLLVIIFQTKTLINQNRNQENAIRLQTVAMNATNYLNCLTEYSETYRALFLNGFADQIYDDLFLSRDLLGNSNWKNYSSKDKLMYEYFEMVYGIIERVFILQKGEWIQKDTWEGWANWIDLLIQHPMFVDFHTDNLGLFNPDFQSFVSNRLEEKLKDRPPAPAYDAL